jgi:hypothetical protein
VWFSSEGRRRSGVRLRFGMAGYQVSMVSNPATLCSSRDVNR